MSFRKLLPVLVLSAVCALPVSARNDNKLVRLFMDWLTSTSSELDPEKVYTPAARWNFAVNGDFKHAGYTQTQSVELDMSSIIEGAYKFPVSVNTSLKGDVDKAVGFQAGYGKLNLGFSKKFGSKGKNNTFSFDYIGAGYAGRLEIYNFAQPVDYEILIGEGFDDFSRTFGVTDNPGKLKAYILDGVYAFNRTGFAYSSAFKGGVYQRSSAGSFLFGTKMILGDFSVDPSELIIQMTGGPSKQSTAQVSFGVGYSYNFVPFHRQPYGEKEKGLRNLTFNATVVPLVSIFNQFSSVIYKESGMEHVPDHKSIMYGRSRVSYVARAAVGYTHDLFTTNLSFSYDSFGYNGVTELPYHGEFYNNVSNSGHFNRWSAVIRVCRHF